MPNPDNLIPHRFPKGVSGNPKGRPALPDLKGILSDCLSDDDISKIINSMKGRAIKGDVKAATFLFDRGWGKPDQKTETTGEQTLAIVHSYHNDPNPPSAPEAEGTTDQP